MTDFKRSSLLLALTAAVLVAAPAPRALAQWVEQSFTLTPGWNAVFLEVDPVPNSCAEAFQGLPIESVWAWDSRFSSVQFADDESIPPTPFEWHGFIGSEPEFVSNLYALQGNRGYLIRLGGYTPVNWTVTGTPAPKDQNWASGDYSLQGFFVDPASPPTFAEYFSASEAHTGPEFKVYDIQSDNLVELDLSTTQIDPGKTYWVYTPTFSSYSGPVEMQQVGSAGLDFGPHVLELPLDLVNLRLDARSITVTSVPSAGAPAGGMTIAGEVPMSYYDAGTGTWLSLGSVSLPFSAGSLAPQRLRIRVDRQGLMTALRTNGSAYQSLLRIEDGSGYRRYLPVIAEVPPPAGLWIGEAVLNKVKQGIHWTGLDPVEDRATDISFPLIMHVSDTGAVTLLRQVTVMWEEGQVDGQGNVLVPGRYVAVPEGVSTAGLKAGYMRDGRPFSFRKTSPVFHEDIALTGAFGTLGTLQGTVNMDKNHPLNPYLHRFHPDHGHPDLLGPVMPDEDMNSKGGYALTREMLMEFSDNDPEREAQGLPPLAGWGDTLAGGIYTEVISGLAKAGYEVSVEGTFRLRRVLGETDLQN